MMINTVMDISTGPATAEGNCSYD